jgi:type I restriction enzyme R subunit
MALGSERASVQAPFIRYAEAAGWRYIDPERAAVLRHGNSGLMLHDLFCDQVERFNTSFVDRERAELIARSLSTLRPTINGNLDAWEWIRGVKKIFDAVEKRDRNVRLLDSNPSSNVYNVTDELTFDNGTPPRIRLDVCLFVNGIPVILLEAKAARLKDGLATSCWP